jgi:hypothetical protein
VEHGGQQSVVEDEEGDERDHERRQRRLQDEDGGEDRGERELRPLVLRPVRAEEMGDRNEREEHGEGDPVAALDGLGPAERGHERDRREDDHELEPPPPGGRGRDRMGRGRSACDVSHGVGPARQAAHPPNG